MTPQDRLKALIWDRLLARLGAEALEQHADFFEFEWGSTASTSA